jgi:hypothetical protein
MGETPVGGAAACDVDRVTAATERM